MNAVLWVSIGILACALALALRLFWRSGEARVGLLAGLVLLQGLGAGALLAATRGDPLGIDAASGAALATLGASAALLFVVRGLGRTLEELDLAEALHWGSMQGVRAVTQLAAGSRGDLAERLAALLEIGCERFGLEVGFLSRVCAGEHEIRALRAPGAFPLEVGARFPLDATLCRHTLAAERPLALEQVSATAWVRGAQPDPLGFEAYLGAPVRAGDRAFGTLVFGSRRARSPRFTASHKDLLALMAQWAGVEIERENGIAARPAAPRDRAHPAPTLHAHPAPTLRARAGRAGIDLDEVLRRVERRIRDLVEPRVHLVVRRSPEPALARPVGVPPESLLLTLVGHAVDAMQGAGTLTLACERLAGDSARWVTLSVSHTGRGDGADELARAFAPGRARARDGLALARLVRALRRGGGDLSVEVDPARGSTITVYLPAAVRETRGQAAPRAEAARPAPPPGN